MNYKRLIADFASGAIDSDTVTLMMDNDSSYFFVDTGDEDTDDELADKLQETYGTSGGYRDIVAVLCAAGVKTDYC